MLRCQTRCLGRLLHERSQSPDLPYSDSETSETSHVTPQAGLSPRLHVHFIWPTLLLTFLSTSAGSKVSTGSSHQQSLPFSLKSLAICDTVCLQRPETWATFNKLFCEATKKKKRKKCMRHFGISEQLSLLGNESLPSLSVVEDWDRDAPASLSGDAPVCPPVQHGQQAATR